LGYCSVSDVRLLRGVSADVLGDADIGVLIDLSDQQIRDDLDDFSEPAPTRIRHLSGASNGNQDLSAS